MADVHFRVPYGHTGTLVFLSLRAREYTGGDIHKEALQDRVRSQYWAS